MSRVGNVCPRISMPYYWTEAPTSHSFPPTIEFVRVRKPWLFWPHSQKFRVSIVNHYLPCGLLQACSHDYLEYVANKPHVNSFYTSADPSRRAYHPCTEPRNRTSRALRTGAEIKVSCQSTYKACCRVDCEKWRRPEWGALSRKPKDTDEWSTSPQPGMEECKLMLILG